MGKPEFGIKHYWLRFEFAPGRGQIHAHCLLIMDNMDMQKFVHEQLYDDKKAEIIKEWAEKQVGLSAAVPSEFDFNQPVAKEDHPAGSYLMEQEDLTKDAVKLAKCCQNHICTNYCMRKRHKM